MNTSEEFDLLAAQCLDIFSKKAIDYGTAWRILRTPSLTDQIYIKAQRIRSIEQKGVAKVHEGVLPEYIGIVNYSVMALIQLEVGVAETMDEMLPADEAIKLYTKYLNQAKELMMNKNHDYGEAWRKMRISSLTDIILMPVLVSRGRSPSPVERMSPFAPKDFGMEGPVMSASRIATL